MIIPRGETVLQPKDVLMLIADDPALQKIRLLCKGQKQK
jgi:Trk K+ transport system NAD-binding subunit